MDDLIRRTLASRLVSLVDILSTPMMTARVLFGYRLISPFHFYDIHFMFVCLLLHSIAIVALTFPLQSILHTCKRKLAIKQRKRPRTNDTRCLFKRDIIHDIRLMRSRLWFMVPHSSFLISFILVT